MNTDRWYYRVFQSAPDLIRSLLPGSAAAASELCLDPAAQPRPPAHRRCGPLTGATTTQIQALPVEKLEALAEALLDFQGPADLSAWLAAHS